MPAFPKTEYADRLARTRRKMHEAGLDLLLVSGPDNMNYLCGYDAWSFYVPQCLLVPAADEEPVWIGRGMDSISTRITTHLPEASILSYADDYVENPAKHPMEEVARTITERGWHKGRIGYEGDAYFFSAKWLQVLEKSLLEATFVDAYLLVNWVRTVKSPAEIEVMRKAARIVEHTMWVAIDAVEVGRRQCDAAARISFAQIEGTPAFGGEAPANPPSILSGVNSATPHASWSDEPFLGDTATCLELSGCKHRYHSAMSRTVYLGKPPQKMLDVAQATGEGLEAALETVRPGVVCEEVDSAWKKTISRYGLEKPSRIGYSIGVNYPPNWADHTASLRAGDKTVLEPNMAFHLMLGMWMDGWGFEMSETFRVTESGSESLTRFPRQLFVKN